MLQINKISIFVKTTTMKHYFLPLLFLTNIAFAQTNIVLQPHYEDGNNTYLRDYNPTSPAVGVADLTAYVWTCDGDPCVGRAFLTFDLSSINVGAIVENATLFLYANTTTTLGFGGSEPHTGNNAAHLFRVTENWDYHTATWDTQPDITFDNSVEIPSSIDPVQDYEIDVTELVQDMVNEPATSYGFSIQLDNEIDFYTSLIFASSFNSNEAKHPKLDITYTGQNEVNNYYLNSFSISPNPAQSFINVNFSNSTTTPLIMNIFDAIGNVVKTVNVPNNSSEINLEISDLADGIYLIGNNDGFSKKFVITK